MLHILTKYSNTCAAEMQNVLFRPEAIFAQYGTYKCHSEGLLEKKECSLLDWLVMQLDFFLAPVPEYTNFFDKNA